MTVKWKPHSQFAYPSGSDLRSTGEDINKKALFIGINYQADARCKLKGCINDAHNMKRFLCAQFHVRDVKILCDNDRNNLPTRQNIINGITWLLDGAKSGDNLFFHYSGHGTQLPDKSGDEVDDLDEVIVPSDFRSMGYISDDELYRMLVHVVPKDVTLVAIIDCCHSGTMLDLPNTYQAIHSAIITRSRQQFVKGRVICISASTDVQTAADVSTNSGSYGALSNVLINTITEKKCRVTLQSLLILITSQLVQFKQTPCISTTDNVRLGRFYFGIENN